MIEISHRFGLTGNVFKNYLAYLVAMAENVFSVANERNTVDETCSLYKLFQSDVAELFAFAQKTPLATSFVDFGDSLVNFIPKKNITKNYIPIIQNSTYNILINDEKEVYGVFYKKDKTYLSYSKLLNNVNYKSFKVPNEAYYIRWHIVNETNIQYFTSLTEGTTPNYELCSIDNVRNDLSAEQFIDWCKDHEVDTLKIEVVKK